jgi:hypothetical protein
VTAVKHVNLEVIKHGWIARNLVTVNCAIVMRNSHQTAEIRRWQLWRGQCLMTEVSVCLENHEETSLCVILYDVLGSRRFWNFIENTISSFIRIEIIAQQRSKNL